MWPFPVNFKMAGEEEYIRSVQDLEKRFSIVSSVQPKNIYNLPQTIEYHLKQAINV